MLWLFLFIFSATLGMTIIRMIRTVVVVRFMDIGDSGGYYDLHLLICARSTAKIVT